jgi:hypothetical protein
VWCVRRNVCLKFWCVGGWHVVADNLYIYERQQDEHEKKNRISEMRNDKTNDQDKTLELRFIEPWCAAIQWPLWFPIIVVGLTNHMVD